MDYPRLPLTQTPETSQAQNQQQPASSPPTIASINRYILGKIIEVDIRLRIIYIESFDGEKSLAVEFTDNDHFDRMLAYHVNYRGDKVVSYIPSGRWDVMKKGNFGKHSPANKDRSYQTSKAWFAGADKHQKSRLSKVRERAIGVQMDAVRQLVKMQEEGALIGRESQDSHFDRLLAYYVNIRGDKVVSYIPSDRGGFWQPIAKSLVTNGMGSNQSKLRSERKTPCGCSFSYGNHVFQSIFLDKVSKVAFPKNIQQWATSIQPTVPTTCSATSSRSTLRHE
ncbi:hypothetical protein JMJ35_004904 [Cladonia borealis]|uniref:Uncharacterized protein n=1 Tax=Cladonia borealis TaxID=184061 RepID=A0AA39R0X6_9LECA|nr:hypothetical protein JMJ35_004904 [Cladonia borealis]